MKVTFKRIEFELETINDVLNCEISDQELTVTVTSLYGCNETLIQSISIDTIKKIIEVMEAIK